MAQAAVPCEESDIIIVVMAQPITWQSKDGKLYANGHRFHLKGVNYFGFETETRYPHGLWAVKLGPILDFCVANGFNAIRCPFSCAMALDLDKKNEQWLEDEDLRGLTGGQLLVRFIDACAERGLLVMLDMHRLNEKDIPDLWYDSDYTEADAIRGWDNVLNITKTKWNVFAVDLNNEPHGTACWGKECERDWNKGAETLANNIIQNHPEFKGLFFIEGVNDMSNVNCDSPCPHATWWGGSFEGLKKTPITLLNDEHNNSRVVWSPHVYGPAVFMQEYFKVPDFPHNLPEIWYAHWGFARDLTGRAVVIGEWGGWYNTPEDQTWQQALAKYLVEHEYTDQFYWCLNPDSGDTGGLLEDDWKTPVQPKLDLLATVQPHPSRILANGGSFVLTREGEQSITL